ncbi:MAG: NAD(P)-dependent alcohol dehydrogenase [Planctomycetales bacterium]|nr:NAD(P)-dependent alcohol dehydrogenase [Planctomycetales bacterium]
MQSHAAPSPASASEKAVSPSNNFIAGETPSSLPSTMQAIIADRYGAPQSLQLRDIELPAIGDDQVLVEVGAAGLHIGDSFATRGKPWVVRVETGWRKPKVGIPGFDLSGRVVAVGKNTQRLKPGDEVFGTTMGSCAEFACVKEATLAHKPASLSFEEAAAVPTSGLAALHALRDAARVQAGQSVLINGAAGGIGTFAIQIAKSLGAEVSGVCSTSNVELLRSLGADHVLDYTQCDFTRGPQRYDVILDNVENRSLADCRRVLAERGTLILNSGTGAQGWAFFVRLIKPLLLSPFARQNLRRYLSLPNLADLQVLAEMLTQGTLRPVVGQRFPLAHTAQAIQHLETGHARGKVVVTLDNLPLGDPQ